MSAIKERMKKVIESFPDDASYEEILRELIFDKMVDKGLEDVRNNRTISDEEMKSRIRTWQK